MHTGKLRSKAQCTVVGAFQMRREIEFSACLKVKKNPRLKYEFKGRAVAKLSAFDELLLGVRLRPQAATHAGEYQYKISEILVKSPLGS